MIFKPRPAQKEIIEYDHGYMGVSAVPGSGKTHTLSFLASKLISEGFIGDDQEVLIVTLVNSAVKNFSNRVEYFVKASGLIPGIGYRVRTLHGLAHDIIKEHPGMVGLSDSYQILEEREKGQIISDIVRNWIQNNPENLKLLKNHEREHNNTYKAQKDWENLLSAVVAAFISQSKDHRTSSYELEKKIKKINMHDPLLHLGITSYIEYQHVLNYRNALDFDDLIVYALKALELDKEYLDRLSHRWPFILEDEAQDSSRLQEMILRKLSNKSGNWVRVGDPNQAIFETFTTANPKYLLNFLDESHTIKKELPNSGRSTQSIIRLANYLIEWSREQHPNIRLRHALNLPYIIPTSKNDPQPNPVDKPNGIYIEYKSLSSEEEIELIINSLKRWLPDHLDQTVAILVPRNDRGARIVEELEANNFEYIELLKSSLSTRETAKILADILKYLNEPSSKSKLLKIIDFFIQDGNEGDTDNYFVEIKNRINKVKFIEDLIWPIGINDKKEDISKESLAIFTNIKTVIQKWHRASVLPIDQLIILIAQDVFTESIDLALAYKLALTLEHNKNSHPEWGLAQFTEELDMIANNRYRYLGFSEEDTGFDPDLYPGKVTVSTIHKAKGLEWDRVYLMSVNNYNFPSAESFDSFISENWFVKGEANLQAELLEKLDIVLVNDISMLNIDFSDATSNARVEYAKERLRLLFVGITRARKELMISWNTGRNINKNPCLPAVALSALKAFYEDEIYANWHN